VVTAQTEIKRKLFAGLDVIMSAICLLSSSASLILGLIFDPEDGRVCSCDMLGRLQTMWRGDPEGRTLQSGKDPFFLAMDFVPVVKRGKANISVVVESTSSTTE
jgi:hypothetical protein